MAKYNNEKRLTVNTFSYVDKAATALSVKLFDNMFSATIHLPKESGDGYDYDHGVTAYLSIKDCKLFSKMGYKALAKYEENGTFETVTLPLTKGVIELTTVGSLKKKLKAFTGDVDNPAALCLVIYADIDENKIPHSYLVHVFSIAKILKDYSPDTGKYATQPIDTVECEYFLDTLKEFAKSMTNCTAHSISNNSKYQRDKWEKIAYELAISLGVDLTKPMSKGGQKSIDWNSSTPTNEASIESRGGPADYKVENIDTDEEDVDAVIEQLING